MQYMEQHGRLPPQAQRIPTIPQGLPSTPDQSAMMMARYRVHRYPNHGEIFPGCHPGLPGSLLMRPALTHFDKEQSYPTNLQSLSPADAEALYNCMDPKLWAESMINPMMLPPMFDSYYNGLDFHAPGYRKNVTKETTGPLKAWLQDHRKNPYPTKAEKIMLAIITKMTLTQVSTWFANARRRLKKETGSRFCSEDGDDKSLSGDDDDISISENKEDSDNEADCEISVDDDEDVELFNVIPRDKDLVTSTSEIPNTSMYSPASRGMTREYVRSHARPYEIPKRVQFPEHPSQRPGTQANSSMCLTRYPHSSVNLSHPIPLCSESDIKPVDLSPGAGVGRSALKHDQNHQGSEYKTVQQQQQRPANSQNQLRDNSQDNQQSAKAKIWSISNILSNDSGKPKT